MKIKTLQDAKSITRGLHAKIEDVIRALSHYLNGTTK